MKKLLYILPDYDTATPTHSTNLYELITRASESLDIFLLVEKGKLLPAISGCKRIYTQKFATPPFSLVERLLVIIFAAACGYKTAYVHYSYLGAIFTALVYKLTGGEVFYWHCEVYDRFFSKFEWKLFVLKKKILDEWLMVLTLRLVNFLVTGSPTVANFYARTFMLPHERIKVLPNWINLEKFRREGSVAYYRKKLRLPQNKKVVLFLHHLAPRKGADRLPYIVDFTLNKIPDALFLIIGDGPLRRLLSVELKTSILKGRVLLLGAIPNEFVRNYYASADLFIMPSRQEGSPRVLLEAMAAGLPFVAMDVGGVRDLLCKAQNDSLVKKDNVDLFSERLVSFLNDKDRMNRLAQAGRTQVKHYSLKSAVQKFFHVIND